MKNCHFFFKISLFLEILKNPEKCHFLAIFSIGADPKKGPKTPIFFQSGLEGVFSGFFGFFPSKIPTEIFRGLREKPRFWPLQGSILALFPRIAKFCIFSCFFSKNHDFLEKSRFFMMIYDFYQFLPQNHQFKRQIDEFFKN